MFSNISILYVCMNVRRNAINVYQGTFVVVDFDLLPSFSKYVIRGKIG